MRQLTIKLKGKKQGNIQIKSASEIASEAKKIFHKRDGLDIREEMILFCLDGAHQVIGWAHISTGGLNSAPIDPKVIYCFAITSASSSVILVHNHPSGSLIPSEEDITITQKIKNGCELLSLTLLDHVIVSSKGYYSFRESGNI